MKEIKIHIGNKEYLVKLVQTEEEQEKGLQGVTSLPENEGMLFVIEDTEEVGIWMKDTNIPLDIVFIDEELNVKSIHQGIPNSEEIMSETDVAFVLEVNQNSGIKEGDELEFNPNSEIKSDKMLVLNGDGTPQMELNSGERIFSRSHTKTLIKFAKRAYETKQEKDFKALGKRVFKFLDLHETQEPEYVELKN